MGSAARNRTGSTKVSKIEEEVLVARYGTVHSGLRAGLDLLLAQPAPAKKRKKSAPSTPPPVVVIPVVEGGTTVTPCRIHREFKVIKRWADHGQDWTTRRCTVCGFEVSRPDHG